MKPGPFHATRKAGICAVLLAAGLGATGASQAQSYQFIDLGNGSAYGINNLGQVVGKSDTGVTLWSGGSTMTLASGGGESYAYAINDAGQIAGASITTRSYATYWGAGSRNAVGLDTPPLGGIVDNSGSYTRGINNAGQIAGNSENGAVIWGPNGSNPTALTLANSNSTSANGINNLGEVVGYARAPSGNAWYVPVEWVKGNATVLPTLGGQYTYANAVNDAGVIVGSATTSIGGNLTYATEWKGSSIITLGSLGGYASQANAINNAGEAVGYSTNAAGNFFAAAWNGSKIVNLNTLLSPSEVQAGWVLLTATGINNNGWITGDAENTKTGTSDAFLLEVSPVPEAGNSSMLAAGLALIGAMAYARRSRGKSTGV
jgi:probable HAF family extracellular repeat protein